MAANYDADDEFDFEEEEERFVREGENSDGEAKELRSAIWETFAQYASAFVENILQQERRDDEEKSDSDQGQRNVHARERELKRELHAKMRGLKSTLERTDGSDSEGSHISSEDSYSSFSDFEDDLAQEETKKRPSSSFTPASIPGYLMKKQSSLTKKMVNMRPQQVDRHMVRRIVSQNRRRYVDKVNGYDLDLVYVTPQLIAMAHPSSGFEMIYRNNYNSVMKFMKENHAKHYRIYNLCMKRKYKLSGGVVHYGFHDHNPCPLPKLSLLMQDMDTWLNANSRNVAGIHCKAGKGRTGVVICCYLLHSKAVDSPEKALKFFGEKRTTNGKGVTIPSQKRYVDYYFRALRSSRLMQRISAASDLSPRLLVTAVTISPIPSFLQGATSTVICKVSAGRTNGLENTVRTKQGDFKVSKFVNDKGKAQKALHWDASKVVGSRGISLSTLLQGDDKADLVDGPVPVQGDFRLGLYTFQKRRVGMKPRKVLQCWLNTNFIEVQAEDSDEWIKAWKIPATKLSDKSARYTSRVVLSKYQIDGLPRKDVKSRQFKDDFILKLKLRVDPIQPPWVPREQ